MANSKRDDEVLAHFYIGKRVRAENEMWPGKWEDGEIVSHSQRGYYGAGIGIRLDSGELVEYDVRYLDHEDERNSYVRSAKH